VGATGEFPWAALAWRWECISRDVSFFGGARVRRVQGAWRWSGVRVGVLASEVRRMRRRGKVRARVFCGWRVIGPGAHLGGGVGGLRRGLLGVLASGTHVYVECVCVRVCACACS
jgi:hypothetical protein